ncbi:phospholipid ABC transporter ATP-binding protein MlaF [Orbaceae bacterium ESL0727]|nr:phospholipid ABC transporter ATP-binding protein MlaF [Orbaceae bacterium ESL0727]
MVNSLQDNLVEIHDMAFYRGTRPIYKNMSLNVAKGKITAIMGPSGIGKTTLLRLIGGQLKPQSGQILFAGENIPSLSRAKLYEARKRMSMLFQSGALFTDLSVYDNVAFPLREHFNLPEPILHNLVLMKLQSVGLRGAAQMMPSELSGGMARRAALARAIALDPELIMFDEPFAGQDPISMGVIVRLISEINQSLGLTCIVVSHDVKEVMSIADYAYIVAEQHIIAGGTSDDLRKNQDPRVKQFLEGLADGPVPFHYPAIDYKMDLCQDGGKPIC